MCKVFRDSCFGFRRSSIDQLRPCEIAVHDPRQDSDVAFDIAEVQRRRGWLAAVAVGPEGVEIAVRIDWPSDVGMVERAFLRQLPGHPPACPPVAADPHRHLAAGIVRLRARLCWPDHPPRAIGLDIERAHIVVVVGREGRPYLPGRTGPPRRRPRPRVVLRPRLIPPARQEQDVPLPRL